MFKYSIFAFILLFTACSSQHQKNVAKLDEVYGECDNPMRSLTTRQYKECKIKEAANFDSEGIDILGIFNKDENNKSQGQSVAMTNVNKYLWNASLNTLENYPIKILDPIGGYIQTEPVYDVQNDEQRCTIKIFVTSMELISNGIDVKLICEEKINNVWVLDKKDYSAEEKKLILSTLSRAKELSQV